MSFWTRRKYARRVENNMKYSRKFRRRVQNVYDASKNVHGALKCTGRVTDICYYISMLFWTRHASFRRVEMTFMTPSPE